MYLVTRSGTWVLNRVADYGRPIDAFINSRFFASLRNVTGIFFVLSIKSKLSADLALSCVLQSLPKAVMEASVQSQLNKRFDHVQYGLKPKHGVYR